MDKLTPVHLTENRIIAPNDRGSKGGGGARWFWKGKGPAEDAESGEEDGDLLYGEVPYEGGPAGKHLNTLA